MDLLSCNCKEKIRKNNFSTGYDLTSCISVKCNPQSSRKLDLEDIIIRFNIKKNKPFDLEEIKNSIRSIKKELLDLNFKKVLWDKIDVFLVQVFNYISVDENFVVDIDLLYENHILKLEKEFDVCLEELIDNNLLNKLNIFSNSWELSTSTNAREIFEVEIRFLFFSKSSFLYENATDPIGKILRIGNSMDKTRYPLKIQDTFGIEYLGKLDYALKSNPNYILYKGSFTNPKVPTPTSELYNLTILNLTKDFDNIKYENSLLEIIKGIKLLRFTLYQSSFTHGNIQAICFISLKEENSEYTDNFSVDFLFEKDFTTGKNFPQIIKKS
jgi:hypothetical protein